MTKGVACSVIRASDVSGTCCDPDRLDDAVELAAVVPAPGAASAAEAFPPLAPAVGPLAGVDEEPELAAGT